MSTHTDSVTAHNTQGFKSLTIEAGTGKIVGAETIEGELIQPFQHTDSVESLAKELRMVANMINMGEKIQWGHETTLMDKAADMLTTLQAHTSQQVEEAVLQADATGAYHSGYLAGKAEVEEAVRKLPRCDCGLSRAFTPNHQD